MDSERNRPTYSMIAAVDDDLNLAIGGKLPWRKQLADKYYYLEKVAGHTIIMGSNTFAGADHSREGLHIKVISGKSHKDLGLNKEDVLGSIEAILTVNPQFGEDEVFITGGGIIFTEVEKSIAERIYLNVILTGKPGSGHKIKFPVLDIENKWKLVSSRKVPPDKDNEFPADFKVFERII